MKINNQLKENMENNNKLVEDYQKLKTKENDYINNINNLKKNIEVKN